VKIAFNKENSGWVIDKIASDYAKYTRHEVVSIRDNPDFFWGCNCFPFGKILRKLPKSCKTCVQIHHIVEDKLKEYDFRSFNKADFVICPNHITIEALKDKINIPVRYLPYWVLDDMRVPVQVMDYKNNSDEVLIGYFQKDTERNGGPKLEKGPDRFLEVIRGIKDFANIKVVLTGYRRSYVINGLKEMGVKYIYFEKADNMASHYDSIDWYFCTSRVEGGPQSILEASFRKVKILSMDCGIAKEVLHPECICKDVDEMIEKFKLDVKHIGHNLLTVKKHYLPEIVIPKWDDLFEGFVNEGKL
jgi:hypothetical protein